MKERPILFSPGMVRAILVGQKSQTRRVITRLAKVHPFRGGAITEIQNIRTEQDAPYDWQFRDRDMRLHQVRDSFMLARCPYGQPGDLLWVREPWIPGDELPEFCRYRADEPNSTEKGWRPAMYMPRRLSRLTLKIQSVWIERLTQITEEGAVAEGCHPVYDSDMRWFGDYSAENGADPKRGCTLLFTARTMFGIMWNRINARRGYAFDESPFVWVIQFEVWRRKD